jgi:hypothetical protein
VGLSTGRKSKTCSIHPFKQPDQLVTNTVMNTVMNAVVTKVDISILVLIAGQMMTAMTTRAAIWFEAIYSKQQMAQVGSVALLFNMDFPEIEQSIVVTHCHYAHANDRSLNSGHFGIAMCVCADYCQTDARNERAIYFYD